MVRAAGVVAAILLVVGSFAATVDAGTLVFSTKDGAIRGYDPVAYFVEGKPVKGSPQYTHNWMGAQWRFASAANRDAFSADPGKYAPQYGGYCAWAVSQGYTAEVDPDAWAVEGGKLYLNYSKGVQATWAKDVPGNILKGDRNWLELKAKLIP